MTPKTAHHLIGTKLELVFILIASAFTCAAVGASTNPATGMAINASGTFVVYFNTCIILSVRDFFIEPSSPLFQAVLALEICTTAHGLVLAFA